MDGTAAWTRRLDTQRGFLQQGQTRGWVAGTESGECQARPPFGVVGLRGDNPLEGGCLLYTSPSPRD
jgi:hypothetical protein